MTSRHLLVWGEEGQNLIRNSRIAVIGLDNIGLETLKSAAMLGISTSENEESMGQIYAADNIRREEDGYFMDIPLKRNEPRAESLQEIFQKEDIKRAFKKPQVSSLGSNNPGLREDLIKNILPLDAIIDVTNNPASQYQAIKIGKELNIDIFLAGCNKRDLEFKYFFPGESSANIQVLAMKKRIPQYNNQNQGVILSTILSGLIIEAFKKRLFMKNRKVFAGKPYAKKLEADDAFYDDITYSLNTRDIRETAQGNLEMEGNFHENAFLVCGCGAIGNAVAEILAKVGARRVDLIDDDTIESHNLERQPLFYECYDKPEYKAKVLCEKIKKINPKIESEFKIGKICENTASLNAGIEKIDKSWFAKNKDKYSVIFGCMDGGLSRFILNTYCTEFGLNYVDGGSSPTQGKAVPFVPGKTVCLECAIKISDDIAIERASCGDTRRIAGNVNMSNRIVAGIMLSEARKIINPELGPAWKGFVMYANNGQGFITMPKTMTCPHYKNDVK